MDFLVTAFTIVLASTSFFGITKKIYTSRYKMRVKAEAQLLDANTNLLTNIKWNNPWDKKCKSCGKFSLIGDTEFCSDFCKNSWNQTCIAKETEKYDFENNPPKEYSWT